MKYGMGLDGSMKKLDSGKSTVSKTVFHQNIVFTKLPGF